MNKAALLVNKPITPSHMESNSPYYKDIFSVEKLNNNKESNSPIKIFQKEEDSRPNSPINFESNDNIKVETVFK